MADRKQKIITFKADRHFLKALDGIHNRSDFIRSAVLAALESTCPLCRGTGILTPDQKRRWEALDGVSTAEGEACESAAARSGESSMNEGEGAS
jgi:hypothetical protein